MSDVYRVIVVCHGNICRSPMGEVVLRARLDAAGLGEAVTVTSGGTSDEEQGDPMDRTARAVLVEAGYTVPAHRAHQVAPGEIGRYDLAVGMNAAHVRALERRNVLDGASTAVRLWRSDGGDVANPYGGTLDTFRDTLRLLEAHADALVDDVRQRVAVPV